MGVSNQTQTVASRERPTAAARSSPRRCHHPVHVVRAKVMWWQGQLLLVLEAIKMEHPLKAGIDGVVKAIHVSAGDQVRNRQVLLQIE